MLMKRLSGILGLVFSGVLLAGCGSTNRVVPDGSGVQAAPATKLLQSMSWALSTVQYGQSAPITVLKAGIPANRYQLTFNGDGMHLQGGCNAAGSNFKLSSPDKMAVGQWMSTKKACMEAFLMRADSEVTGLLSNVSNYRLNGQQLTLSGGGNALVFNGTATDATRYDGEGLRKFIEIRNTSGGLSWREATYDSRWIQNNKNAPWMQSNFPGIRDFKPEMNTAYIVRINEYRDQSTGKAVWVKDTVTMQGIL